MEDASVIESHEAGHFAPVASADRRVQAASPASGVGLSFSGFGMIAWPNRDAPATKPSPSRPQYSVSTSGSQVPS